MVQQLSCSQAGGVQFGSTLPRSTRLSGSIYQNEGVPDVAYLTPVCACVWRGGVTLPGAGLAFKVCCLLLFVVCCRPGGGRCFSRYVSGDGGHTDVFS